nr:unnamed protein product [Digitaria exilis]
MTLPSRLRHLRRLLAAAPLPTLAATLSPNPSSFRSSHPTRIPPPRLHRPVLPARRLFSEHAAIPTHLQDERFAGVSDRIYDAVIKTEAESNDGTEAALDALGAELTTPLVADVLHRLRFEEKLAFRFFAWASHQDGYTHEPSTYNDIIDILSGTRYKSRQFGVLCDILDHMKRHGTRSVPVDDLLAILRAYTEKHLTHMRKLAKKRRVRMRTPPETDALNMLLDAFCKCGMVREAEAVFGRVKRRLLGNSETYSIMFFGWCRARDPKKAMKLHTELRSEDLERAMPRSPGTGILSCASDAFKRAQVEFSEVETSWAGPGRSRGKMWLALTEKISLPSDFSRFPSHARCWCQRAEVLCSIQTPADPPKIEQDLSRARLCSRTVRGPGPGRCVAMIDGNVVEVYRPVPFSGVASRRRRCGVRSDLRFIPNPNRNLPNGRERESTSLARLSQI